MVLSPISPIGLHSVPDRENGDYIFVDRNDLNIEYKNRSGNVKIIKPWENELVFKSLDNRIEKPHFKVINYESLSTEDKDDCSELLPAPVHRKELNGLTMRPELNRDVLSKFLKLSVFGSSTFLKYKNDDPLNYGIVAWEQDIKYARDNYVSITYRAVDAFTGLKLQISIISERHYKNGLSYLQKRYYVSYAEREKVYDNELVISGTPFKRIIPQDGGAYFHPLRIQNTESSYLVNQEGTDAFDHKYIIPFNYIGIDKDNKEHSLSLKIIFIPAESYELEEGRFFYDTNDLGKYYEAPKKLGIHEIGLLDPRNEKNYKGEQDTTPRVDCPNNADYKYSIIKTFENLKSTELPELRKHIKANLKSYQVNVNNELTFAKIDKLKEYNLISLDSSSSSFETRHLTFLPSLGIKEDGKVSYDDPFPIAPYMDEADVVISQIDQIEGLKEYRTVHFADTYKAGKRDLDEIDRGDYNRAKLLFKLKEPIAGFFSKHFKESGPIANTGIIISHISGLDQGIAYNEDHNKSERNKSLNFGSVGIKKVSSPSIFGSSDAEILGIPLLQIVQEVLDIKELPEFNYLKELRDSFEKIESIADQYVDQYQNWKNEFDTIKSNIQKYKNDIENINSKIEGKIKEKPRKWVESILDDFRLRQYYNRQNDFVTKNFETYKSLSDTVGKKIETIVNIDNEIKKFLIHDYSKSDLPIKLVVNLLEVGKVTSPEYFRELVILSIIVLS
jgi:hypothetical protein